MVCVWIPIIAIGVWVIVVVVVLIIGWIPGTSYIGIAVWMIGFPLMAVIGKRIVPPAPHAAGIIIGCVSATKNPTRWKPCRFLIMIRLCQAN